MSSDRKIDKVRARNSQISNEETEEEVLDRERKRRHDYELVRMEASVRLKDENEKKLKEKNVRATREMHKNAHFALDAGRGSHFTRVLDFLNTKENALLSSVLVNDFPKHKFGRYLKFDFLYNIESDPISARRAVLRDLSDLCAEKSVDCKLLASAENYWDGNLHGQSLYFFSLHFIDEDGKKSEKVQFYSAKYKDGEILKTSRYKCENNDRIDDLKRLANDRGYKNFQQTLFKSDKRYLPMEFMALKPEDFIEIILFMHNVKMKCFKRTYCVIYNNSSDPDSFDTYYLYGMFSEEDKDVEFVLQSLSKNNWIAYAHRSRNMLWNVTPATVEYYMENKFSYETNTENAQNVLLTLLNEGEIISSTPIVSSSQNDLRVNVKDSDIFYPWLIISDDSDRYSRAKLHASEDVRSSKDKQFPLVIQRVIKYVKEIIENDKKDPFFPTVIPILSCLFLYEKSVLEM